MKINSLYNEDCLFILARMPSNFIDLTVTSPPYDNLRSYHGYHFYFENTEGRPLYTNRILTSLPTVTII